MTPFMGFHSWQQDVAGYENRNELGHNIIVSNLMEPFNLVAVIITDDFGNSQVTLHPTPATEASIRAYNHYFNQGPDITVADLLNDPVGTVNRLIATPEEDGGFSYRQERVREALRSGLDEEAN